MFRKVFDINSYFPENSIDEKKSQGPTFISSRTIKIVELKDVCGQLHASKDSGFVQEFRV